LGANPIVVAVQSKRELGMTQAAIASIDLRELESAADAMGFAPQESRVIALLAQGSEDKQIASRLNTSYSTVRTYVSRAFEKSGATGRMELAMLVHAQINAMQKQKPRGSTR